MPHKKQCYLNQSLLCTHTHTTQMRKTRRARFLTHAYSNEYFKTSDNPSLKILSIFSFTTFLLVHLFDEYFRCSNYLQSIVLNFRDFQTSQQISAFKEFKFQCGVTTGMYTGWHVYKKSVALTLAWSVRKHSRTYV